MRSILRNCRGRVRTKMYGYSKPAAPWSSDWSATSAASMRIESDIMNEPRATDEGSDLRCDRARNRIRLPIAHRDQRRRPHTTTDFFRRSALVLVCLMAATVAAKAAETAPPAYKGDGGKVRLLVNPAGTNSFVPVTMRKYHLDAK